ncbi:hypothetical protein L0665_00750 [Methanogenium marinum]|uniref:Uncharacterized protein n=1 Tax=Methanogenium marinum TaxID=348610 RepID=A0A9Q4KR55_9EURY|nr:hypothetical protein [Methanogenium marinum]MDE4907157.1 hypothetical protein [Methanogenium marinum]
MVFLIIPAVQADELFNISKIDSPDTVSMDYSKTPLGTTDALLGYIQYLSDLTEELVDFIASIFDMLGMEDDPQVNDLMTELNQSRDMIKP